ncbi:DUF1836 domain-containing protein [Abyssisolibacter fermentans]|uniref:DUF1836 domain-containing protein n=1 Tax=Abyssisolibacter fermentans TaxID=1766203 RepID=UPI000831BF49|nr:DUF1836 domain-containing protein [Abyssisolibacter fermentans]
MEKCKNLLSYKQVGVEDIPNIDLYMDQLTGYIDTVFEKFKIDKDEKILTKTMINNYVKAKIIDKPTKKKYNKDQIMQLIMIYNLKNILSISEIDKLYKVQKNQLEANNNEKKDECVVTECLTSNTEEMYKNFLEVQQEVIKEAKIDFEENSKLEKEDMIKHVFKLVLKADINKRLAEHTLAELSNIKNKSV